MSKVEKEKKEVDLVQDSGKSRRVFLKDVGKIAFYAGSYALFGNLLWDGTFGLYYWRQNPRLLLRPPGAIKETEFLGACIRCFQCGQVCNYNVIKFVPSNDGVLADTPYIDARSNPCKLCMSCTQICPAGALLPIEEKKETVAKKVKIGIAKIDRETCVAWNGTSHGCTVCYWQCPYRDEAMILETTERLPRPIVVEDKCVGCGYCENICITDPQSIRVVPRGLDYDKVST